MNKNKKSQLLTTLAACLAWHMQDCWLHSNDERKYVFWKTQREAILNAIELVQEEKTDEVY